MNIQQAKPGTIRASLRYPAFRWLLGGLAVSQLGDWLYNLALIALVYERTHSALWAGITTAARVVPVVALGPLGGVVADRFDRRRIMITCDVARIVLMVLLALFVATHAPIVLAPVIAAVATAFATPYLPCVAAHHTPPGRRRRLARRERRPVSGQRTRHHRRARPRRGPAAARSAGPGFPAERGHVRAGGARGAGHSRGPDLPARPAGRGHGRTAARDSHRRGGAALLSRRPAAGGGGHHVQHDLRRPDGAAAPGVPLARDGRARLRLPVRRRRGRRPGRHGAGRPGAALGTPPVRARRRALPPSGCPCRCWPSCPARRRHRARRGHRHGGGPGGDPHRHRPAADAGRGRVRPGLRAGAACLAGRDRRGLARRAAPGGRAGRDRGAGGRGARGAGLRADPAPPGPGPARSPAPPRRSRPPSRSPPEVSWSPSRK